MGALTLSREEFNGARFPGLASPNGADVWHFRFRLSKTVSALAVQLTCLKPITSEKKIVGTFKNFLYNSLSNLSEKEACRNCGTNYHHV